MTVEEFARLLAAHGPDIDTWPSRARRAALRLRDDDATAQDLWEGALRRWSAPPPDGLESQPGAARIQAGIDASLRRIRQQRAAPSLPRPWAAWLTLRPAGAVLATMVVAGWLAGTWLSPEPGGPAGAGSLAALFILSGVGGDWLVQ
ncbi:hypothetical protein [Nitrospirillum iridis]|uniref:Uncharacterized protein n=1 Tax=Nitrospirillum iridis TaxID=765888 RepID=A0A7X0AYB9_9PROT|nr:hypothetical protein [Nitrospirillum iridis]MBB6252393.1 hypothetical protein [Nitrospirillum iridis]